MGFDRNNHLVIIGMPRGGTTYLYNSFMDHPKMFVPIYKEICFFNSSVFSKGKRWYEDLYVNCGKDEFAVDVSPPMFLEEDSFQRLEDTYPDAKKIMIVRDPAEWSLSFYYQLTVSGLIDISLEDYYKNKISYDSPTGEYHLEMANGYIYRKIKEAMDVFGDSLLLYKFEYFKDNKVKVMNIIEDFLEIERYYNKSNVINKKINFSGRKYAGPVSSLMQMDLMWSFIHFLPERFVKRIRTTIDRFSAPQDGKKNVENYYTDEELDLARKYMFGQKNDIEKLFENSPVITGDGSIVIV